MRLGIRKLSLPTLAVLLGSMALLASAGCGSSSSNPIGNLASSQVFNYPLNLTGSADFSSLDPNLCQDTTCAQADQFIFGGGLFAEDANLNVQKWDAKNYDLSPDRLTYTSHLHGKLRIFN